jgi:integrase
MIYRRGKNGTFWYRFRFAGRMIHESTRSASKTVAREAERQRRRELVERVNNIGKKRELPPTFAVASKRWLETWGPTVAESTLNSARWALKPVLAVFAAKLLCDIEPGDIADYQRSRLQAGKQGRTVNIEVGKLSQVLKMYDQWRPFDGKVRDCRERKTIGKALTREQESALLQAAAKADSACYTAVVVALNTTMCKKEICTLRWSQIDFEKRTLVVGESKNDARTGRLIPLNVVAYEALFRWAGRYPDAQPAHFVFPSCESKHVDHTRPTKGWRTAWRHALKQAGFRCRFHDLRHTAITKLAETQASDSTVMGIAGHVSREMMEHYSHIRTEAKRKALDAIAAQAVFEGAVHQNVHQIEAGVSDTPRKPLN